MPPESIPSTMAGERAGLCSSLGPVHRLHDTCRGKSRKHVVERVRAKRVCDDLSLLIPEDGPVQGALYLSSPKVFVQAEFISAAKCLTRLNR